MWKTFIYRMNMQVIVASGPEIASRHAARSVKRLLKNKPGAAFLLPTGGTPLRLYELLAAAVNSGQVSFSQARTFNLDEYLGISPQHPQSYHSFMRENLFSKIDIKKINARTPLSRPADPQKFCAKYEKEIRAADIDLAILGIGRNGHLAFNEPGTPLASVTRVANLAPSTISANARFFKKPGDVPRQAVTVGLSTIMAAQKIIVLAFGEDKADAVKAAIEGPVTPDVPASVLQQHRGVTFVLDRAAAAGLRNTTATPPHLGKIRLYSSFNLPRGRKIAFFSPHPDDAAICAGGLLSELAKHNEVHELIMTTGHRAVPGAASAKTAAAVREREVKAESKILGTRLHLMRCRYYDNGEEIIESDLKKIRALLRRLKPDIAFLPHKHDTHPTHVKARKLALASLPHGIALWSFETPWGLFTHSRVNAAFEFDEDVMDVKLAAIRAHKSQLARTAFDHAARDIAHFRRITLGEQFFSDLGAASVKTLPYLELFNIARW